MRTIKFRGKCAKDSRYAGEWVYGGLLQCEKSKDVLIVYPITDTCSCTYHVDPTTVGQFTGLFDKYGNEIYEGDILREPPKNEYEKENYTAYEVFWHGNDCASHHIGWQMNRCHFQGNICGTMYIPEFLPKETARMVVIGNIYDHPSLIEKGGQQ